MVLSAIRREPETKRGEFYTSAKLAAVGRYMSAFPSYAPTAPPPSCPRRQIDSHFFTAKIWERQIASQPRARARLPG